LQLDGRQTHEDSIGAWAMQVEIGGFEAYFTLCGGDGVGVSNRRPAFLLTLYRSDKYK
jgi:hypothetical protein